MIATRLAGPSDFPAIHALYERCAYHGGLADTDQILVVSSGSDLLGAVRLCREDGVVVLRGMQVDPDHRRRGIGISLLDACAEALGTRTCFCLPYDHLIDFYGRVGFQLLDEGELPPFLLERFRRYRHAGVAVVPMVRAGSR